MKKSTKSKAVMKDKVLSKIEEEFKRHTNVLVEKMDSTVKTVTEQHGSIVKKLEDHDRCFDALETAITEVDARVKKVEQKLDTVTEGHEQRLRKLEAVR